MVLPKEARNDFLSSEFVFVLPPRLVSDVSEGITMTTGYSASVDGDYVAFHRRRQLSY